MDSYDEELLQLYTRHLDSIQTRIESGDTLETRLKKVRMSRLGRGTSQDEAAVSLGISARSLRRHLSELGTTFRRVSSEVRIDIAKQQLMNKNTSIKALSGLLGFDDVNAFRRAFKSWIGMTITEYRRSLVLNQRR